jgi:hypothetical protein
MRAAIHFASFAIAVVCVSPSHAAVRLCQGEISSGLHKAKSEQEARALAIASWNSQAKDLGVGYTWRGATNRYLNCAPGQDGGYQCLAKALPCIISQVPTPPGSFQPVAPAGVKS